MFGGRETDSTSVLRRGDLKMAVLIGRGPPLKLVRLGGLLAAYLVRPSGDATLQVNPSVGMLDNGQNADLPRFLCGRGP